MTIKLEHISAFPDREKSACHLLLTPGMSANKFYIELYTWRIVLRLTKSMVVNRITNQAIPPVNLPLTGRTVEFVVVHKNRAGTVAVESWA